MESNNPDPYWIESQSDDSDVSDDEFEIGIKRMHNGKEIIEKYVVPQNSSNMEKTLICRSVINRILCKHGNKCTFAHSLDEQEIEYGRNYIYQILLDEKMMDFYSLTNPKTKDIYQHLIYFCTRYCNNCLMGKCTGGYNCIKGVCDKSLLVCRDNLFYGNCSRPLSQINISENVKKKIDNVVVIENKLVGCVNGHHLTMRGLPSFKNYCHQKELYKNNEDVENLSYFKFHPENIMATYDSELQEDDEFIELVMESPSLKSMN